MKSYLLFPILFLSALSLPFSLSCEENREEQQPATTEHPTYQTHDEHPAEKHDSQNEQHSFMHEAQHSNLPDMDHRVVPGTWPDHVPHEGDSFETKFFNMLFILGLLIGFMILASWALKRMMRSKVHQLNTASSIKVLETRNISPRTTLYLVEVQDQAVLIAESPTAVTYLKSFPLSEEEDSSEMSNPPPFPNIK